MLLPSVGWNPQRLPFAGLVAFVALSAWSVAFSQRLLQRLRAPVSYPPSSALPPLLLLAETFQLDVTKQSQTPYPIRP